MSVQNKRHGLVLNQFNSKQPTLETIPSSSSSNRSSIASNSENRKSIGLTINKNRLSVALSLENLLISNENTSTSNNHTSSIISSPSMTDLSSVNVYADRRHSVMNMGSDKLARGGSTLNSNSSNSNSIEDYDKYRQDTLSKLRNMKNNSNFASSNKENSKSESLAKLTSTLSKANLVNNDKRTPLASRTSSNLNSLKHNSVSNTSNNTSKNNRQSTYSINSITSTASTKSNKSTSSLHKMAQRIARSVSGGSGSHETNDVDASPDFKRNSARSSSISSRKHKTLSGGSAQLLEEYSRNEVNASKPTQNAGLKLLDLFNPPARASTEDSDQIVNSVEYGDHEDTEQQFTSMPQPDIQPQTSNAATTTDSSRFSTLNTKSAFSLSSRFRLKHSISLRSLSSNTDNNNNNNNNHNVNNDNESIMSTTSTTTMSRSKLFRRSIMSIGASSRNSVHLSNTNSNTISAGNNSISGQVKSNNATAPSISLPIPQQATRNKLNSKLKNSSSLLSISSFVSNNGDVTVNSIPVQEFEMIHSRLLLKLCKQARIVSFASFMIKLKSNGRSLHLLDNQDINEINYNSSSKLFVEKQTSSGFPICVWKVIPFGNSNYHQLNIQEAIQELSIGLTMTSIPGFIKIRSASVVRGNFPPELKQLYAIKSKDKEIKDYNSFIHNLDLLGSYSNDQQYLVLRLENGGEPLNSFKLENWNQAYNIFWQIVNILKDGEAKYEFEHRDLNLNNILISKNPTVDDLLNVNVKLIDFKLARAKVQNNIMFTSLDNPEFFKGKGDYQFDIYQFIRREIVNLNSTNTSFTEKTTDANDPDKGTSTLHQSPSFMSINSQLNDDPRGKLNDWSVDCPKSNILWLHYILEKMINSKGLTKYKLSLSTLNKLSEQERENFQRYETMVYMHKCLDPKRKRTRGNTRFKKSVFGDLKPAYYFDDFANLKEILEWGKKFNLID